MKGWIAWMMAAMMCIIPGAQAEEACTACGKCVVTENCMTGRSSIGQEVMTSRNDLLTCHYAACTYYTQVQCSRCGSRWARGQQENMLYTCDTAGMQYAIDLNTGLAVHTGQYTGRPAVMGEKP